jgi:aminopeptidase N
MLGTNESLYGWMDEGFTTYAEDKTAAFLSGYTGFALDDTYKSYYALARSNKEEPLTTHADHYNWNAAYSPAVYSKGAVFLEQLG